jgi:hypothetical protein
MKTKIILGMVVLALGFLGAKLGLFESPAVPEKVTAASANVEVPAVTSEGSSEKTLSMGILSSPSSSEDAELNQIVDETVMELLGPPPPAEMAELEEKEQLPLEQF